MQNGFTPAASRRTQLENGSVTQAALCGRAVEIAGFVDCQAGARTGCIHPPLEPVNRRFLPSAASNRRKLKDRAASVGVINSTSTAKNGRAVQISGAVEHQVSLWVGAVSATLKRVNRV